MSKEILKRKLIKNIKDQLNRYKTDNNLMSVTMMNENSSNTKLRLNDILIW